MITKISTQTLKKSCHCPDICPLPTLMSSIHKTKMAIHMILNF